MNMDFSFDLESQMKALDVYNICKKELRKRQKKRFYQNN